MKMVVYNNISMALLPYIVHNNSIFQFPLTHVMYLLLLPTTENLWYMIEL